MLNRVDYNIDGDALNSAIKATVGSLNLEEQDLHSKLSFVTGKGRACDIWGETLPRALTKKWTGRAKDQEQLSLRLDKLRSWTI